MKKNLFIATGGSGGHIYPAIAVAEELSEDFDLLFIGGGLDKNPFFPRNHFNYVSLNAENFQKRTPFRFGKRFLASFLSSLRYIKHYRPVAIVGFGTVFSLPVMLAAKCTRCPIILHEANSRPGKVVRLISPYVHRVAIHFPDAEKHIKGNCLPCSMPLRKQLTDGRSSKEKALAFFGLEEGRTTLLVLGGSQGALFINRLMRKTAEHLFGGQWQVIHLAGKDKGIDQLKENYGQLGIPYYVREYEERMDLAWSAADLAVTRAGASSIAEQIEYSVPGVLIPYPFAEKHQEFNADYFVSAVGGGVKLIQSEAGDEALFHSLSAIRKDRERYRDNLAVYRKTLKNMTFANLIKETVNGPIR